MLLSSSGSADEKAPSKPGRRQNASVKVLSGRVERHIWVKPFGAVKRKRHCAGRFARLRGRRNSGGEPSAMLPIRQQTSGQAGKEHVHARWRYDLYRPWVTASRPNIQWCILREPVIQRGPRLRAQASGDGGFSSESTSIPFRRLLTLHSLGRLAWPKGDSCREYRRGRAHRCPYYLVLS
jgi:hypothetical protein